MAQTAWTRSSTREIRPITAGKSSRCSSSSKIKSAKPWAITRGPSSTFSSWAEIETKMPCSKAPSQNSWLLKAIPTATIRHSIKTTTRLATVKIWMALLIGRTISLTQAEPTALPRESTLQEELLSVEVTWTMSRWFKEISTHNTINWAALVKAWRFRRRSKSRSKPRSLPASIIIQAFITWAIKAASTRLQHKGSSMMAVQTNPITTSSTTHHNSTRNHMLGRLAHRPKLQSQDKALWSTIRRMQASIHRSLPSPWSIPSQTAQACPLTTSRIFRTLTWCSKPKRVDQL